jgi:hypothetical protein
MFLPTPTKLPAELEHRVHPAKLRLAVRHALWIGVHEHVGALDRLTVLAYDGDTYLGTVAECSRDSLSMVLPLAVETVAAASFHTPEEA